MKITALSHFVALCSTGICATSMSTVVEANAAVKMVYLNCLGTSTADDQIPVRQRRGYAVALKGTFSEVAAIETPNSSCGAGDCRTSIGEHRCRKQEKLNAFTVTRTLNISRATAEVEELVLVSPANPIIDSSLFVGECEISNSPKI